MRAGLSAAAGQRGNAGVGVMNDDSGIKLRYEPWYGSRVEPLWPDAIRTPFWWALRLMLGAGAGGLVITAGMLALVRLAMWANP